MTPQEKIALQKYENGESFQYLLLSMKIQLF